MKYPIIVGSILLMAPVAAQAQTLDEAPSVVLPKPSRPTPALDAFAGASTQLQLQARWVQIDNAALLANLPAWNKAAARSHVATHDELVTLEILRATGAASINNQQISALNNQAAELWFAPLTEINEGIEIVPTPPDEMIIPRAASPFAAAPYIPNLAKPESKLSQMAPMPGINSKLGVRLIEPLPAPKFYSRPFVRMVNSKFQLRPTLTGERIALELRNLGAAQGRPMTATLNPGETAVFSLPAANFELSKATARRSFLLVTPRAVTMQPRPGQTQAPGDLAFIAPSQSPFIFTP